MTYQTDEPYTFCELGWESSFFRYQVSESYTDHHLQRWRER